MGGDGGIRHKGEGKRRREKDNKEEKGVRRRKEGSLAMKKQRWRESL